ncbi:hypothetical protein PR048_007205 [Dryococelus australis]|uniref:Uncharacterized protein n=1 Tax=Dryococelus australis TaxID=614101 RepID=A0ABQ9IF60_9NEOP|nr:hypothetical protein PR048_007205 [Dryococelus australis]
MRVKRGEYRAAPEIKGWRNGRSPRKPANQWHRLTRFPRAEIRERPRRESNPVRDKYVLVSGVLLATSEQRTALICDWLVPISETASVLTADEGGNEGSMQQRRNARAGYKREIPEKTRRPTTSSDTFPTCRKYRSYPPGTEPRFANVGGRGVYLQCLDTADEFLWRSRRVRRRSRVREVPGLTRSSESMRVLEGTEQRRNEGTGETGDPRENPLTNGIVQYDSHITASGCGRLRAQLPPSTPAAPHPYL